LLEDSILNDFQQNRKSTYIISFKLSLLPGHMAKVFQERRMLQKGILEKNQGGLRWRTLTDQGASKAAIKSIKNGGANENMSFSNCAST